MRCGRWCLSVGLRDSAVLDIIVKMLPELASKIAEPMGNIEKVTVVDTGTGDGATRVSKYVTSLMATAPQMVKDVSGIDLEQLVKNLTEKKSSPSTASASSPLPVISPAPSDKTVHMPSEE